MQRPMAETEPKHRKPAVANTIEGQEADDGEDKERAPRTRAGVVSGLMRFLQRRRLDIVAIGIYVAMMAFGCLVVETRLLEPSDALVVQFARPVFYAILVLFNLSWLGIVYHGPGRPPAALNSRPPPELAEMLNAGRFCKDGPLDANEGACDKCGAWKPILAHHCSTCGTCSLWMDHHCNFAAQCIGFRNTRCLLLWGFYGEVLVIVAVILSLHRLVMFGLPDGALEWAAGAAWACDVYCSWNVCRTFASKMLARIGPGWPSRLLMAKFYSIDRSAKSLMSDLAEAQKTLEKTSPGDTETVVIDAMSKKLTSAVAGVTRGKRMFKNSISGPFLCDDLQGALTLAFGEPPCWRWAVPLLAGGAGDPIRPEKFDREACKAWATLASALDQAHPSLARAQWLAGEWSRRVQSILGGAPPERTDSP